MSGAKHKKKGSNRILIFWSGAVVLLAIACAAVLISAIQARGSESPEELKAMGLERFEHGEYEQAYGFLKRALEINPDDLESHKKASQAALATKRPREALGHAKYAWEHGLRDLDLLTVLMFSHDRTGDEAALNNALILVTELPEELVTSELMGDIYNHYGFKNEALEQWAQTYQSEPAPRLISKYTRTLIETGALDKALAILQAARKDDLLISSSYRSLTGIHALLDQYGKAEEIYAEAKQKEGMYTSGMQLEHALLKLLQLDYSGAEALLQNISLTSDEPIEIRNYRASRLYLAWIYYRNSNADRLNTLLDSNNLKQDSAWTEGAGYYIRSLIASLNGSEDAKPLAISASTLIPKHPIIKYTLITHHLQDGDYKAALRVSQTVQGALSRWAPMRYATAVALARDGKTREAFNELERLRRRGMATRDSLILYRDLAQSLGEDRIAQNAQELLAKTFPDDKEVAAYSGTVAITQGREDEAFTIFSELSAKYPEDVRLQTAPVQALLRAGKYEQVIAEADKTDSPSPTLSLLKALACIALKKNDDAITALEEVLEDPAMAGDATVHANHAYLLMQQGRKREAEASYRKAYALAPGNLKANFALALLGSEQGKNIDTHLRVILKNEDKLGAQESIFVATYQLNRGNLQDARKFLAIAENLEPRNIRVITLRSQINLAENNFAQAMRDYHAILALQPDNTYAREGLARMHILTGKPQRALDAVNRLLEKAPDSIPYLRLKLDALLALKQTEDALLVVKQMGGHLSTLDKALALADIARAEGNLAEAERHLAPHMEAPAALVQWARIKIATGEAAALQARLQTATLETSEWLKIGEAAIAERQYGLAEKCFGQALAATPDNLDAMNNWVWSAVHTPRFTSDEPYRKDVLETARKAYQMEPEDPNILDTYAEVMTRGGEYEQCKDVLTNHPSLLLHNAQLIYFTALSYEKIEDTQQAIQMYERSLALLKADPETRIRGADQNSLQSTIQKLKATLP